jgi:hypothetical protein
MCSVLKISVYTEGVLSVILNLITFAHVDLFAKNQKH